MSRAEVIGGLAIVAFGVLTLEEMLAKLPYYVEDVPGPGFLPFWLSLAIIVLGLVVTVRSARTGASSGEAVQWPDLGGWWRVGISVAGLALALAVLQPLGFVVTTLLYVGCVSFGLGTRSWRVLVPVSILMAVVLYGVFGLWLQVPLPKGILAFMG